MAATPRNEENVCAYEQCDRSVSGEERCYWHREVDGKCPKQELDLDMCFPGI